jgi:hypothetical protein
MYRYSCTYTIIEMLSGVFYPVLGTTWRMKFVGKVLLRAKEFTQEKTACNTQAFFNRCLNMKKIHRENDESMAWTDNNILYNIQRANLFWP